MAAQAGPTGSGRKQRGVQVRFQGKPLSRRSTEKLYSVPGRKHKATDISAPAEKPARARRTATAAAGQKKHARAAGLTRRGAPRKGLRISTFYATKAAW